MENRSQITALVSLVFASLLAAVWGLRAEDRDDYALWCGVAAALVLILWVVWAFLWPLLERHGHGRLGTIVKAEYGTHTHREDVMQYVKGNVTHGVLAMLVVDGELGGDPAPGEAKTLYITVRRGLKTDDLTFKQGTVIQVFRLRARRKQQEDQLKSRGPLR